MCRLLTVADRVEIAQGLKAWWTVASGGRRRHCWSMTASLPADGRTVSHERSTGSSTPYPKVNLPSTGCCCVRSEPAGADPARLVSVAPRSWG